jgi:hypothetical protein
MTAESPLLRAIFTAPEAAAPMRRLDVAELRAGRGIVGDRYYLGLGHWSDPRWPDQEVTLFEEEVAQRLRRPPEDFRRNLITAGIRLETLVGVRFRIGSGPVMLGVRPCDPCAYIERFAGEGAARALVGIAGGLRATILEDGAVHAGDPILIEPGAVKA